MQIEPMIARISSLIDHAESAYRQYAHAVTSAGSANPNDDQAWRAAWLVEHGIADALNAPVDGNDLTDLLHDLRVQYGSDTSTVTWSDYVARRLIDAYAPSA